jgi:acetate kinase
MENVLLTINVGSSSFKFALFARTPPPATIPARPLLVGQYDGIGTAAGFLKVKDAQDRPIASTALDLSGADPHRQALEHLAHRLQECASDKRVVGVGHRVVHGGQEYSRPIRLDTAAIARLHRLIPLAPLHQPHNLAGIEVLRAALPDVPQIACFDTAFHRSQPPVAQIFALPRRITAGGVRRYGFHGLSYEYIADVLPQYLPPFLAEGRVIVAHLGNGASMCALVARRSQATTMGFSAIDGLMMGTRPGALDPGVLLHLLNHAGMDAAALGELLYKESGLLGVSGISHDMRTLLASDRPEAQEAIELFCYRSVREIGSLAAAIGGLDALVFTGGIGERAAPVRAGICAQLGWLGVGLDEEANAADARHIGAPSARVATLVLPTNEEWMLARHTAALLG